MDPCCQTRSKILEAQARLMRIAESVRVRFRCPTCGRKHDLEFSFVRVGRG